MRTGIRTSTCLATCTSMPEAIVLSSRPSSRRCHRADDAIRSAHRGLRRTPTRMCGFIGCIRSGACSSADGLERAVAVLRRRGPDSWRQWRSVDRTVALLHARLAIVDPVEAAAQPFVDERHQLALVFNGEIYNHVELRQRWAAYGFQTAADTEVILAAWHTEGLVGLSRLRGMFSFALVDLRRRELVL